MGQTAGANKSHPLQPVRGANRRTDRLTEFTVCRSVINGGTVQFSTIGTTGNSISGSSS